MTARKTIDPRKMPRSEPPAPSRSLLNTEERYRLLVDAVTDYAIYMLDADGFVVSWNSGAQRLKGYTEEEIVGRHFSQFYLPDDVRAGMPARTLSTAAREGRFSAEGWRQRKDGGRFWAHVVVDPIRSAGGDLIGYAKVTRDLTERLIAEQSLRRSEEQFRLLVQGVTDYAIYMIDPGGNVTNWNAGAQRIKGYLPEEVVGTHFSRFYRSADRERGQPMSALATAAREGRFEAEGWRVRKDGTEFWANVVIDPIRDERGVIVGFAKITRDITEKRNAQLALERAREALFQSQKLDAIGQLTGGVAHDFNNLLMVVLSSLELLRRRVPDDERTLRLIDNAVQGAKRGAILTQRMLSFARRQDLNPTAVDLPALIRGMQDLLERSLGPAISVETDLPPVPAVLIDANQLELAILNLAVNARDAMPQGGLLTISCRHEAPPGAPQGAALAEAVCLSIADSGDGMDETVLTHAVEPFFTTKGIGKGTGLGLPMVHGLAVQSGGQLVLKSVPGQGTTAELWLPVAPHAVQPESAAAASRDDPGPLPPMLVIVVDDDPLVLTGTCSMLEDRGHTVLAASSGAQALELAAAHPEAALVVTDEMMPGMAGSEFIRRLHRERPGMPVVLASGFGDVHGTLGAAAVRLGKPFDQRQLLDAMHAALGAAKGGSLR
jgi:PAS domain S-box-containing protein